MFALSDEDGPWGVPPFARVHGNWRETRLGVRSRELRVVTQGVKVFEAFQDAVLPAGEGRVLNPRGNVS